MRKSFILILLFCVNICFSQTHTRKTRSDKGKTHKHSASYAVKKALKPKATKTTKPRKKK